MVRNFFFFHLIILFLSMDFFKHFCIISFYYFHLISHALLLPYYYFTPLDFIYLLSPSIFLILLNQFFHFNFKTFTLLYFFFFQVVPVFLWKSWVLCLETSQMTILLPALMSLLCLRYAYKFYLNYYTIYYNILSFLFSQHGTGVSVEAVDEVFQSEMLEMLKQTSRSEMVVGWYHSHPGFGCFLSSVDMNTQTSFEQLNSRAVISSLPNLFLLLFFSYIHYFRLPLSLILFNLSKVRSSLTLSV